VNNPPLLDTPDAIEVMPVVLPLPSSDVVPPIPMLPPLEVMPLTYTLESGRQMPEVEVDRTQLERTIAVINGKGGVQKTTVAANVGGLLAASGYRVLLVDMDPQGNLAEDLGYTGTTIDDSGHALAASLTFGGPLAPAPDVRPNLDVLIGGHHLDAAAAALSSRASKDTRGARLILAQLLAAIAGNYDLVLIDCPPGNEPLQAAAAAAARWALVPVKTDQSSRKGLLEVARRLDGVVDINPGLDLLGVVLVGVGTTAHKVQEMARNKISEELGGTERIFNTTIRHSEATAQAARERGLLVHELDAEIRKGPTWWQIRRGDATAGSSAGPRTAGSVADDLHALATEIVGRITSSEKVAV
jgi:chromosome partitioning protein